MKWIKLDEAIESIAKRMLTREEWYKSSDAKESAKYMLKDTSPIEIIQCKDCKYLGIKDLVYGYCKYRMTGTIMPDDYCSYGERRNP